MLAFAKPFAGQLLSRGQGRPVGDARHKWHPRSREPADLLSSSLRPDPACAQNRLFRGEPHRLPPTHGAAIGCKSREMVLREEKSNRHGVEAFAACKSNSINIEYRENSRFLQVFTSRVYIPRRIFSSNFRSKILMNPRSCTLPLGPRLVHLSFDSVRICEFRSDPIVTTRLALFQPVRANRERERERKREAAFCFVVDRVCGVRQVRKIAFRSSVSKAGDLGRSILQRQRIRISRARIMERNDGK